MAADHSDDPFHHVRDWPYFEFPFGTHIPLPEVPFLPSPTKAGLWLDGELAFGEIWGLQLTKFMVLQTAAGIAAALIFWGLARRVRDGSPVRGGWWNFWELLAVYIRDEVVRPAIGHGHDDHGHHDHAENDAGVYDPGTDHGPYETPETSERASHGRLVPHGGAAALSVAHPADKYLPFIWTLFFYILFCNLLGAVPVLGAPMGHIAVTGVLALVSFAYVISTGMREQGVADFWKHIAPTMDIPGFIGPIVKVMIWVIEFIGLLIKHFVLAVRLFANIMAGHTVIAVILGFIAVVAAPGMADWLWYAVTPASILGQVFIGFLELFVAFLQAYVFALLTSLFIGMAVHPH